MLECQGVSKSFGGVHALSDVSLSVASGEILGLIGPNGSGKSTLVNVISGFVRADAGSVLLEGRDVTRSSPTHVRRLGLVRTFQNLRLVEPLTVLENMLIGLHLVYTGQRSLYWQWLPAMLGTPGARRRDREARGLALAALELVGLEQCAGLRVANLSYGEKKRLELARAAALEPRVLLLDEPTAGLDPDDAHELIGLITRFVDGDEDRCVVLIEHRLELVLDICSRVAVLDSGTKIVEGEPAAVAADKDVIRVYIGDEGVSDAVER